jgi:hypothetical protein
VLNAAADDDFERIVDNALYALSLPDGRPCPTRASITLVAGQREYAAPESLLAVRGPTEWGMDSRQDYQPWQAGFLHKPLFLRIVETDSGRGLQVNRAPTASEISSYGEACYFTYYKLHTLTDEASTVATVDMPLLLLRGQVEAVHELMLRNYTEPVSVMGGSDDINGSAQQVYAVLLGKYFGYCRA